MKQIYVYLYVNKFGSFNLHSLDWKSEQNFIRCTCYNLNALYWWIDQLISCSSTCIACLLLFLLLRLCLSFQRESVWSIFQSSYTLCHRRDFDENVHHQCNFRIQSKVVSSFIVNASRFYLYMKLRRMRLRTNILNVCDIHECFDIESFRVFFRFVWNFVVIEWWDALTNIVCMKSV